MQFDHAYLHKSDHGPGIVGHEQRRVSRMQFDGQFLGSRNLRPLLVFLEKELAIDAVRRPDKRERPIAKVWQCPFCDCLVVTRDFELGMRRAGINDALSTSDLISSESSK